MQIGDYYNKGGLTGVVISVDASGQHGLLMSLRSYHCQWYNGSRDVKTNARDQYDGMKNQEYIRNHYGLSQYPAFAYCVGLGSGWYLPAIGELRPLCEPTNYAAVEGTLTQYGEKLFPGNHNAELFLSSTEGDRVAHDLDHLMVLVLGVSSWGVEITSDTKRSAYECVRAVHKF